MPTIKDVAKLAGVAVSTASYALNNSNKVKEETKNKVMKAAEELNYQKNGLASDLKRTSTNTIALILSDLSGPYYSELIKGVQDITRTHGFDLIACSSIGGSASTALKFLREKRVDGVIILAHNIKDETIQSSARQDFPIVVLDRSLDNEFVNEIEVDNVQGAFTATEYLIHKGHQEIAYISGPANSHDNELRLQGYKNALNHHQLPYRSKWKISGEFTREGGYKATKMLIAQNDLPEGIFYGNDEMAVGGLQALKENGITVPEDISVIGFDDIQLSEFVSPPLTTMKQPKYEAGALAVHLIFQLLSNEKVENYYKLSTELVERESVKDRNA
ncbi:LacI family DNA-binding transcriptional regulator [Longirhabdus pacifica]|uniref:LacI family DNA-binding transcriptional regulator n=1 Tax=Longirhabdus pacifica TaxID=2305227 RepID=UPI0010088A9D|nr:LacI family DNA-binding transcriptional regulator [Longirhabdus pacifica]